MTHLRNLMSSLIVQDSKPEKKQDEKLEEYSEGVQKRIAKLTRKWREAERQKDAAVHYAQSVEEKRKAWEAKYFKIRFHVSERFRSKDQEPIGCR